LHQVGSRWQRPNWNILIFRGTLDLGYRTQFCNNTYLFLNTAIYRIKNQIIAKQKDIGRLIPKQIYRNLVPCHRFKTPQNYINKHKAQVLGLQLNKVIALEPLVYNLVVLIKWPWAG